ncbi:S1C family serine protease [Mesoterricola sediminis]|nr:trypsin-like peptidase domain-containing protein [Mesoterricola sediminis]
MRKIAAITLILSAGLVIGWCSGQVGSLASGRGAAAPRAVTPRGPLPAAEQAVVDRFKEARSSVVYLTSLGYQQDFWSLDVQAVPLGTGSGFIWDAEGHIVTNFHVIQDAQEVEAALADGSRHKARVIGVAPEKDLAVLRLQDAGALKLRPIPLGSSADLQVGQSVLAIGNPFGLDQTLTTGVVSALGREIQSATRRRITGVIQTDAAINPGNSGGPLLDSAGRLIGINTAIQSTSGSSAGIGFAVPVDTINRIVPQLISRGQPVRVDLGFDTIPDTWAAHMGVPSGVIVGRVVRGGAADRAGLRGLTRTVRGYVLGDVILAANGVQVKDIDRLLDLAEALPADARIQLEVLRDGRKVKLTLELGGGRV